MSKLLRLAIALIPTFAFIAFAGVYLGRKWHDVPAAGASGRGKLVVVAAFDQLRGDYPTRWAKLLGPGGFQRIERDGVSYRNAHWPYSCTATGPGHATIGTGTTPDEHGIIENEWRDSASGTRLYCSAPKKKTLRIPGDDEASFSPERLLVPGLGDRLKSNRKQANVFSIALKDRAAVMMGGQHPNGAYCFDSRNGEFHTSSWYVDRAPNWVEQFNDANKADAWFDRRWERLGTAADYDAAVGPDDAPGETKFDRDDKTGSPIGYGRVFPHAMNIDDQPYPNKRYYERLESSPFGNDLLWQFAEACIRGEQLGRRGEVDLLFLGFSANDLIGHKWGPDSHEVLDATLRTDKLLERMIADLDASLGAGNYTLFVTADHGICPLPEREFAKNSEAERFDWRSEVDPAAMGEYLDEKFGALSANPKAWFLLDPKGQGFFPHVYLNRTAIEAHGAKVDDVAVTLAKWLANRPHLTRVFTAKELSGAPSTDPCLRRCQLGFHPERTGDVYCVTKPYCLGQGVAALGTSHGTPHDYDTHVPLMAFGSGIAAEGPKDDRIDATKLGAMIRDVLGLP